MADPKFPFNADLVDPDSVVSPFNNRDQRREAVTSLENFTDLGRDLGNRNTVGDAAVNILDTLQSIGNIPLAALPGYELQDSGSNSQILDELRSPAYLAAQKLRALSRNPDAGFVEGAGDAFVDSLSSDNLVADAAAQIPYLLMGPAARLTAVARAEKAAGIMGKVAKYTLGTNEAATINRLAALSGGLEGAGAYAQTYERALAQTGSEEEATRQAQQAAGASAILGAALGRLTPGFELNPVGRGSAVKLASHLSAIGAEAIVEEGGLAIGQTVFDNVLAGKNPMEGVGEAFGEAAAISGVFTGVIRSPAAILDTSKAIGSGVRAGLRVAGRNVTTPEAAAVDAADAATTPPQATPVAPEPTEVSNEQEAAIERAAIQSVEAEQERANERRSESPAQTAAEAAQVQPAIEEGTAGSEAGSTVRDGIEPAIQPEAPVEVDTTSDSNAARAVLVDAKLDQAIENSTGAEQAAAISRKEELAPFVEAAQQEIEKVSEERVAEYVELANKGNHEASQRVKAIQRADVTKLPDAAIPEPLKPIVQQIKELKDLGLDKTSNEILQEGFDSSTKSRGIQGYLQGLINLRALGVAKPNTTASEMVRFVAHLTKRADAFRTALAEVEATKGPVEVAGTKTRSEKGGVTNKPFILRPHKHSIATAERVLADAARAEKSLVLARSTFPEMFEKAAPVVAPVRQEAPKPKKDITPKPSVAEVAPTAAELKAEEEIVLAKEAIKAADVASREQEAEDVAIVAKEVLKAAEASAPVGKATVYRGVPVGIDPEAPTNSGLLFFADSKRDAEEYAGEGSDVLSKKVELTAENTKAYPNRAAVLADNGVDPKGPGASDSAALYKAAANYFAKPGAKEWIQFSYPELEGQIEFIQNAAANPAVEVAPVVEKTQATAADFPASAATFVQFDGESRFEDAFVPNGNGLLANSYSDIVTALRIGTKDQQEAAEVLNNFVPDLVADINKYIQSVLNKPHTSGDKTLLKDALDSGSPLPDYSNYTWLHLLTKTPTGYALHPAAVQAAAVAALMQATRAAFQRSEITPDTADETTDGVYYQWLQNISRDSQRIMGVYENNNESLTLTDGMPKSLAATVLHVLSIPQDEETPAAVSVTKEAVDGKTLVHVTLLPSVATKLREFPQFAGVMRKVFGDSHTDTIVYGTPPTQVSAVYRNSRTPITEEQNTALDNRQKVDHRRNTGFLKLLEALQGPNGAKAGYEKLITGFAAVSSNPKLKKLSTSLISGIHGELNAVTQYNADLEAYALANNMKPEDVPVYFKYEILRNGRSYSGYSPQTKKTLREFLGIRLKPMDLGNEKHVKYLKLAMAQALGIKTDVLTHDQIIAELDKRITDPVLVNKASAVYRASQGEAVDNLFELLDRDSVYEPKELHGLMTLGKYLANPNSSSFDNTLTFEIDGKTNGPFMAELLFGLHNIDDMTWMNLEQGGLFEDAPQGTLATMQAYLRTKYQGSADLYERVARGAEVLKDPILLLADFTNEAGEISRTAAKEAVTPLVYGSGEEALSRVFERRINNGLAERLRLAIKQNDTAMVNYLSGVIDSQAVALLGGELAAGLVESYRKQKPQVSFTNSLMVAATTLHVAVRKALFEKASHKALKGLHDTGLLPGQYELSRDSYNQILFDIPSTAITVPNMGTVAVGESSFRGRSSTRVEGAGKVNSVRVSKPEIKLPGVSILALLTQAAGDAAMGNYLFQDFEQVLDVYDGIEMDPLDIDPMGIKLNDAVWQSSSDSLLDEFIPMLDWVSKHKDSLLLEVGYTDTVEKGKKVRHHFFVNGEIEYPISKETYDEHQKHNASVEKTLDDLDTLTNVNNRDPIKALQAQIKQTALAIKIGRAELNSKPRGLNQMSGGGIGYTTDVGTPVRSEEVIGDFRDGWNDTIAAEFSARPRALDRTDIINVLDNHKWTNKIHQAIWNKLRNLLPVDLNVTLARTKEEWDALGTGKAYGTVMGTSHRDTGQVSLATSDPTTILHELIHQVITGNLVQYFSNINAVPVELRSPINDLHQLMKRFLNMKGDDTTSLVQSVVRDLDAKGDTAGAVDEMVAYVLTEEAVINDLQPSFFERVVNRIKSILSALFGTTATPLFMDEVMDAFGRLADGPNMDVNDGTTRASVVFDKTTAAFATIQRKVERGQLNSKMVPKVKDSGLDKIQFTRNLDVEQQYLFKRVWMLMRMDTRSGVTERFASTVLQYHPQAGMFNGNKDAVAAVMALTAADPTFRAQADAIWKQHAPQPYTAEALFDMALLRAPLTDGSTILNEALDTMRNEGEYKLSFLGTVTGRLDRMANEWMEWVGNKADKRSQTAPVGIDEGLKAISALTSEDGAAAFGKSLLHWANTATDQRWYQDFIASVVGSQDDTNTLYRQVNSMKANIAETRSLFTTHLPAQLKTLFPEGFDGWNHLFNHLGRIDAGVLGSSAAQMYQDDAARARAITALESKFPNHWDARNLAHYMVHGSVEPNSPHALLRNARAIADNLNGRKRRAPESLVADIDQLVTLYAINKLSQTDRARIAGYFTTHARSMENIVGMLQKISSEELNQYDQDHRYTYWKGALPLSTDPRASVVVAGAIRGAELEKLGYKKAKRYQVGTNDPASDLHYYTRDYAPPPVFSQGVLSTVQQSSQGINYTTATTISPEVGTLITNPRLVAYIRNSPSRNSTLVPIFNFEGDIAGYERLLDRKFVQEATKSNDTLLHIAIGTKLGRITEERMAKHFNNAAIGILKQQWDAGVAANEQNQYEDVSASTDKQVQRAWAVIPPETKKALEEAFGGPVMIRKDLVANTLGYHKAGIMDIYTGNASVNDETRRAFFGLAETVFLGKNGAKQLFAAEQAIKEAVATAKDWIVVRSLTVAISNAMASMNLVIANGVPIKELFTSYREGMSDLRTYAKLQKDIVGLTVKIAGAGKVEAARLRTIQDGKRASMRRLAIWPLIEAGELSDLPEGLDETPDHSYLGDLSGWLNNHLRKMHPKLPMVAANAIIAKDTAFHNALSKAIQAGDFLGKWAVYKHMVKSGKSVEVARDTIRDEFISYGTNPGRFRGALEDFGVVWWSQFTLRTQKVLLRRFRKNPFSFFLSAGFGAVTGADAPSDAQLFERGWDNSTGLDNVINAPSAHIWAKVF